ncbi:hypothetical protein ACFX2I_029681 [Malus domestica]
MLSLIIVTQIFLLSANFRSYWDALVLYGCLLGTLIDPLILFLEFWISELEIQWHQSFNFFFFMEKTIEGTAAGITSVLAACSVLLPLLASTGYILTEHWCSLLLAVAVSGMLEAYTAQLVNAFVPLIFYSLLCL